MSEKFYSPFFTKQRGFQFFFIVFIAWLLYGAIYLYRQAWVEQEGLESETPPSTIQSPPPSFPYKTTEAASFLSSIHPLFFSHPLSNNGGAKPQAPSSIPVRQVTLLLRGMGLSPRLLSDLLPHLPPSIGLIFSPYAPHLRENIQTVRHRGFVTLISVPLANGNKDQDRGSATLNPDMTKEAIRTHLEALKNIGANGLYLEGGSVFLQYSLAVEHLANGLSTGYFVVPPDGWGHVFYRILAQKGISIPPQVTLENPQRSDQLALHSLIEKTGKAILLFDVYPLVHRELQEWIQFFQRSGIQIVPLLSFDEGSIVSPKETIQKKMISYK